MKTARQKIPGARAVPRPQRVARPGGADKLDGPRHNRALRPGTGRAPSGELAELRARLAESEETLRAIRNGEVDAVMATGKQGPQVFTLIGAGHAYRVLIESMNEGALTLTADKTILYANQCFARMVKCPLEQVMGGSFRRFLSDADRATLRPLMKRPGKSGSKIQVLLNASDGSQMPVQISLRLLARNGFKRAPVGMVVTDMTAARRSEEMLRILTHRVVQAQEAERGHVALELHDNITQLLCAVLVRSQTLADKLSARDGSSKKEAIKLREMLGQTAEEVERISRNLRPSVLNELGLVAVLRDTSTEFADRTGVSLKLACVQLITRLPADTELTLYRILQEALKNVEKHARAHHVTVSLRKQGDLVQLAIKDDGIGFDVDHQPTGRKGKSGLGLFSMRERANYVGGALDVKSGLGRGTTVQAQIPLANQRRSPTNDARQPTTLANQRRSPTNDARQPTTLANQRRSPTNDARQPTTLANQRRSPTNDARQPTTLANQRRSPTNDGLGGGRLADGVR